MINVYSQVVLNNLILETAEIYKSKLVCYLACICIFLVQEAILSKVLKDT
jgi:hypothetical protein